MKKKLKILPCPICGTELYITNQREVKCLCLHKFAVLGSGRDKKLIEIEQLPAVKKAMQVNIAF